MYMYPTDSVFLESPVFVQSVSHVQLFATPGTVVGQAPLSCFVYVGKWCNASNTSYKYYVYEEGAMLWITNEKFWKLHKNC